MLIFLRFIGWVLIVVALVVLGIELWDFAMTGSFAFSTWGELWYRMDPGSLITQQVDTEAFDAGHGLDCFVLPLSLQYEHRVDQVCGA